MSIENNQISLISDDCDTDVDVKLSMFLGHNGDYYLRLKENATEIDFRFAMSGGNSVNFKARKAIIDLYNSLHE